MTLRTPQRLLGVTFAVASSALACSALTEPPDVSVTVPAAPAPTAADTAAHPAPSAAPTPAPTPPQNESIAASHILIAYTGALRAQPNLTRTKELARARAQLILTRAKKGEDFGKLADETSDDPSVKMNHGALGKFTKEQMVKPFSDAAFALPPGGLSDVVETPFGFHVIKRTE